MWRTVREPVNAAVDRQASFRITLGAELDSVSAEFARISAGTGISLSFLSFTIATVSLAVSVVALIASSG